VVQLLCGSLARLFGQKESASHDIEEAPAAYAGPDHPQAGRGQQAAGRGPGTRRGVPASVEVAELTWHRWIAQYGGMKASDARRLKELEA